MNANRLVSNVYIKRKPFKSYLGHRGPHWAKFARHPPIAYWAIEIRFPNEQSDIVWEVRLIKETRWRLEYDVGRWEYSELKPIKASAKKLRDLTLLIEKLMINTHLARSMFYANIL